MLPLAIPSARPGSSSWDATYVAACDTFGETGLIELVGIIGYYCMVSLTLNAFEVSLTDGMEDPFPDD
jgi:4-carboxymuconolactone decarboxylase